MAKNSTLKTMNLHNECSNWRHHLNGYEKSKRWKLRQKQRGNGGDQSAVPPPRKRRRNNMPAAAQSTDNNGTAAALTHAGENGEIPLSN